MLSFFQSGGKTREKNRIPKIQANINAQTVYINKTKNVMNLLFFKYDFILSPPSGFEVTAELKPNHENVTGLNVLLTRTGLHPKILNQVPETDKKKSE